VNPGRKSPLSSDLSAKSQGCGHYRLRDLSAGIFEKSIY
jgi:hypothetical protein